MKILNILLSAAVLFGACANAELLLYEPFDYTAGERLGGSGTSPLGMVAPNGQQWITRSPAAEGNYNPANDTLITAGNLTYEGLATSIGSSVRYGSSANNGAGLYTTAIALPNAFTSGSLYYSMIVRLNGPVNPFTSARTSYASFSSESANPVTDAGLGLATASGTSTPLPASAWIRTVSGNVNYQLGSGKINTDGMGPSALAPSWQSSAAGHPYPNQQGNTSGAGQDWATISEDLYFIVMKYTFNPAGGNDDTVSMWINPVALTLGHEVGEAAAGAPGGSYYSALNATVTGAFDVTQIQSFLLIGQAVASAASARSIDVSLDELRIGTTWAAVTPAVIPEPGALGFLVVAGLGLLCSRRR